MLPSFRPCGAHGESTARRLFLFGFPFAARRRSRSNPPTDVPFAEDPVWCVAGRFRAPRLHWRGALASDPLRESQRWETRRPEDCCATDGAGLPMERRRGVSAC